MQKQDAGKVEISDMKKVAFHNLGCKVNSYELDAVQQLLEERGYVTVPFDEKADIYIVNTCTVTNIADRKSRQMLHRAKAMNPEAVVVALGCYVQTDQQGVARDLSIDLAIGNNRKKDIIPILEEYLEKKGQPLSSPAIIDINDTCDYEELKLKKTAEHTRAYIKIQDGCNQFCTYCIIPYARGRVRSRYREDILREIQGLAENGYKEIVLTGIHISSYGIDFDEEAWQRGESLKRVKESGRVDYQGKTRLLELLKAVHEIEGIERIRIGSLEPRIVTPEFAMEISKLPKICPHFHLSLQSGAAQTLKRMNRHYTPGEYKDSVAALRAAYGQPAITTDVIVGFPGETREEFAESKAFVEEIGFYEMHIFKYSKRKGTIAEKLPNQLTEAEKTQRSSILQESEKKMSVEFRKKYVDMDAEVLFEETKELQGKSYRIGHTVDYVKVALPGDEDWSNQLKNVHITGFLTEEIMICTYNS